MIKISYDEAAYILNYGGSHTFEKFFCNHYLKQENKNSYTIYCYTKWWFHILIFPITTLIHLIMCFWDCGLKEFEFESRQVYAWYDCGFYDDTSLDPDETRFGRMEKIWYKYNPQ